LEVMMAGKFEWQFKYRDEADVNAPTPGAHDKCRKSLFCRDFCNSSDSVYLGIFGQR